MPPLQRAPSEGELIPIGELLHVWGHVYAKLLQGTVVTLELTALSLLAALLLGGVLTALRMTGHRVVARATGYFIEVVRSTPVIVILFLVYTLRGIAGFPAAVISLGLFYATLYAEVYRSGLNSVDVGQREAASALGMGTAKTMWRVILPQALVAILPPSTNLATDLIKDTALVIEVSVADIMYQSYEAGSQDFKYMDVFLLAGVIYFVICYGLSIFARRWEIRAQRSRA